MLLSFIIPVLNEQDSLRQLVSEIVASCGAHSHEIVVIDDGSRDGTWKLLQELARADTAIRAVKFRRNFGKAAALQYGFALATGDVVFTLDGDLQDNPAEVPRFLAKLAEGWDLVSGWKQKRHDPWHKVIPSRLFNYVAARTFGLKLRDFNCGFKAYRPELVKELRLYGEMHRYIPALANALGYRIAEIPVEHRPREFGRSKYGLERYLRGFFDLLTVKMVTQYIKSPLYLFGRAGLFATLLGTAITVYLSVLKLFFHQPLSNRPLLILGITLILGGLQFISLGLISELIINRLSDGKESLVSVEQTLNLPPGESVRR